MNVIYGDARQFQLKEIEAPVHDTGHGLAI